MLKPIFCTARDLGAVLGLSERRISELTRVKMFGKPYELVASVRGYIAFLKTDPGTLKAERLRLAKVKADLMELTLGQRRGELVRRAAVANREFSTAREVRDGLQNIGARLGGPVAAEHDPVTCAGMIDHEILLCLEALTHEKTTPHA